jgi:hypothetical protein
MADTRKHDAWIRMSGWEDGRDSQTGRKWSSIGQTADFSASVREHYIRWEGSGRRSRPVCAYSWHVVRQRTMREGPDERGRHWTGYLAEGEADTMAHAKSAATRELRRLRAEHIAAGGDVGYGDAMTGDEIRAILKIKVDSSQPVMLS